MQQEFISSFNQIGKNMVNSAKEFAEINGRFAGKVLESQIGLAKVLVETGEKQVDVAESIQSPTDYVTKQAALVEELSGKISDATKNSVKIAEQTNLELKSWFEKGIKTADEAVKETKETVAAAVTTSAATKPVAKKAKAPAAAKKSAAKASVKAKPATKTAAKAPAKPKAAAKPAAARKAKPAARKPAAATKKAAPVKAEAKPTAAKKTEAKTAKADKPAADK